jgi:dipeptidyl aminopeptidase/acylaminoacyl peptidase
MLTPTEYLDALLALPGLGNTRFSRDGRWVAWTWSGAAPVADVYAAPTDGSAASVRLTAGTENTRLVDWTPDSRAVLVRQDHGGDERMRLFRVDLDQPLALTPLTEDRPNYFLRGGALHPNGRWLCYGANVDVASGREIEPTWVYRHDLATGERRVLARPEQACGAAPELSPDGAWILYHRADLHPAGRQVWLVDSEGREDRELLNFGADVKTYGSWLPDGHRVLVQSETKTHTRLGVYDVADGALRWLIDDPARNIEDAYAPENGSGQIVVAEVRAARIAASLLDPSTGAETPFLTVSGNLVPRAPVGGAWICRYASSRQPADLVLVPPDATGPEQFTSLTRVWDRTALTPGDFTPAEDFRWRADDGLPIQGWLYRAQGAARGTIVYIHGGPTSHSQDQINNELQFFARQGFNVLDPNYRGSTGFGLAFREAIKEDGWGGREQTDIRAGIEALIAAGIATPGQVGVTGTSYGGYSSWCAITRFPPKLVAAAAPICGMTDLVVDYETTRPDLRPYSEEMLGGSPDDVPERYIERSPIHFVGDIRGKLLIVQGERDPNVTPENVRAVRAALDRAGITYDVLTFPDEGHGIGRPDNQRILYQRLVEFFAQAFTG